MSRTSQPLPPASVGGLVLGEDQSPSAGVSGGRFCCPVLQPCLCHAVELLPGSLRFGSVLLPC